MRRCCFLACVLALLPSLADADDVLLKGGGKISGRILSRTDTAIEVNVGAGIITVPMTSVIRVEEKRSVLDDYDERAAALRPNDAAGWLQLAKWAASHGLGTQARHAYERVLALDPGNVDANLALGRVLHEGRWVSEQESYRAKGLVPFEGEWLTPAERDAIVYDRDRRSMELARLDAERRIREAEARVAEAEARAREAEAASARAVVGLPLWWGGWGPVGGGYPYRRYGAPKAPRYGQQMWPSPPLGPWPSQPIGVWPSQPIGLWPAPPPPAIRPSSPPPSGHQQTKPPAPRPAPRARPR